MQREIKFRIFFDSEMLPWNGTVHGKPFYLAPTAGNPCVVFFHDKTHEPHFIGEGRLLGVMEYTGLKDKHGKEIYEGDILKGDNQPIGVIKWFDSLTWDSGGSSHPGFYCEEWMEETDLDYHSSFRDVEVIGNIYETPELLSMEAKT